MPMGRSGLCTKDLASLAQAHNHEGVEPGTRLKYTYPFGVVMPTGEHVGDMDIAVSDMSNRFIKSIHTFSLRLSQGLTSRGPEQDRPRTTPGDWFLFV